MCVTNVVVMVKFFILLLCVCARARVCVCVCVCVCDVVTQNGFFCEICRTRMLKDRKAVLQHINVDTHIGQIEVCILIRYDT